jgi:hypothetical protein
MTIDPRRLVTKLARWLYERGKEEAEKEVEAQLEKRQGDPQRRTGMSPPATPGRAPWERPPL